MSKKDFKRAFTLSLPVLGAYWFLGITYGLLAAGMGYPLWISATMAMTVYSGSVEFLALSLLSGTFNPLSTFVVAFVVGARHLFYGISMFDRFRGAGWKKPFLIYFMSDETFALNYTQGGSFSQQLWVSILDFSYWLSGGIMGYVLGTTMGDGFMQRLEGLDFVLTVMFVAIFMDDFVRHPHSHSSAWTGICVASACLLFFGSQQFLVPAMLGILIILYLKYKRSDL